MTQEHLLPQSPDSPQVMLDAFPASATKSPHNPIVEGGLAGKGC
jgi:hypothetical protein